MAERPRTMNHRSRLPGNCRLLTYDSSEEQGAHCQLPARKAPEDRRSPKPTRHFDGLRTAARFWTAPVLGRFSVSAEVVFIQPARRDRGLITCVSGVERGVDAASTCSLNGALDFCPMLLTIRALKQRESRVPSPPR